MGFLPKGQGTGVTGGQPPRLYSEQSPLLALFPAACSLPATGAEPQGWANTAAIRHFQAGSCIQGFSQLSGWSLSSVRTLVLCTWKWAPIETSVAATGWLRA